MTDPTAPDADTDRIREAAAGWLAHNGHRPSARSQRDLDRWLAADPRHDVAYRRIARHFDGARLLRTSRRYADRPRPAHRSGRTAMGVTAAAVATIALFFVLPIRHPSLPQTSIDQAARAVAGTDAGAPRIGRRSVPQVAAIRAIGLADGSVVTVDVGGAIDVAFSTGARRLTLRRGRARFTVAHDGRPFTVFAGGGSVTARGTIFDVALSSQGQVRVVLLRGSVDVAPAALRQSSDKGIGVRRLLPGEAIGFSSGSVVPGSMTTSIADRRWIDGAVDFDNVSLGYLLESANRGAQMPIRVVDPSLAVLRVSGRFDLANRDRLAMNLGRLFDLRVEKRADAITLGRD